LKPIGPRLTLAHRTPASRCPSSEARRDWYRRERRNPRRCEFGSSSQRSAQCGISWSGGRRPIRVGHIEPVGPQTRRSPSSISRAESLRAIPPGEALLDPIAFAPRLVAATAGVVNDVFDRLSLQTDKSWSGEHGADAVALDARTEWPFRDVDRAALILTSPLTGLVLIRPMAVNPRKGLGGVMIHTKNGEPLSRSGDDLFDSSGRHGARLRGTNAFGPSGRYVGPWQAIGLSIGVPIAS